jgi:hypothetical protein
MYVRTSLYVSIHEVLSLKLHSQNILKLSLYAINIKNIRI